MSLKNHTINANTHQYWQENDLVIVSTGRIGIIDGWFYWPDHVHHPSCVDPHKITWWPVRVHKYNHKFYPTHYDVRNIPYEYILRNITLDKKVRRIQALYRTNRCGDASMQPG